MKKLALCLSIALVFGAGCAKWSRPPVFPISQLVSYPTGQDQFVIIAVEDNEMTATQAKKAARQKAAQVTLDNGYQYYTVLSETEIQVVKTSTTDGSQTPGNLYQELIVQKQFGRETLEKNQYGSTDTLPAIRLEIQCYREKPGMKNSIDAQKFLNQ